MSGNTPIEWTDKVWNPVRGCSRVSPGCKNCYAERVAWRFGQKEGQPYHGLVEMTSQGPKWNGQLREVPTALLEPLSVRKPAMWFVNSMSDLFHESVPFDFIDQVFAVMALAKHHTFQVLTKRSTRMREYFMTRREFVGHDGTTREEVGLWARVLDAEKRGELLQSCEYLMLDPIQVGRSWTPTWPLPNVWLCVSVEDQQRAEERIPDLLLTPAAVRGVSVEPLLAPVDLTSIRIPTGFPYATHDCHLDALGSGLSWVITGFESGPGARPGHPQWARDLRDQCHAAGVPYFFKQWGEWAPAEQVTDSTLLPGEHYAAVHASGDEPVIYGSKAFAHPNPERALMVRVGKFNAGRQLDGRTHDAYPATVITTQERHE